VRGNNRDSVAPCNSRRQGCNVLKRRYDTASDDRIWEIVTLDLRALRTAVRKIIAKHKRKT